VKSGLFLGCAHLELGSPGKIQRASGLPYFVPVSFEFFGLSIIL
jgi:hypothetical protein